MQLDHAFYMSLAYTIIVFSAYTMFSMVGNLNSRRPFRHYWFLGSSAVFALGVWSMHFVAMLASNYLVSITAESFLALFLLGGAAYSAFLLLGEGETSKLRLGASSLIIASSVAFMHYMCVLMHHVRLFDLNPSLLAAGLAVLLAGTYSSLQVYMKHGGKRRFPASFVFGTGAIAFHLLALESLSYGRGSSDQPTARIDQYLMFMGLLLALATVIIFSFSIVAWVADRRYGLINERYKLLVENSIDMIAVISEGKWEFVNRSGLRMFEAADESDMVGKSVYGFLCPDCHERLRSHLARHPRGGKPSGRPSPQAPAVAIELDWLTLGGRPISTELIHSESTFSGQPVAIVIIRDISERKKNEELLINSEKLYVAGQLAAGIAHEIRNPLTSLKGFLQLIASGRTSGSPYFDIMKSELNRIENIVSELLMLSKPQVYEMDYTDVREIMLDTVLLLESQASLYGIEIEAVYGSEPLWIYGVEPQVKQVFINVLKNAIEVMVEGGKIIIATELREEEVLVTVKDEGPGIDEEQLSKMGQPFYTTKDKGTGLGLMVSYKIVDNHKGRIRVASELGEGTSFQIYLPYCADARRSSLGSLGS